MDYINIKGTVGDTKVNLTLSIPVETIIKSTPKTLEMLAKHMPTLMKAINGFSEKIKEMDKK